MKYLNLTTGFNPLNSKIENEVSYKMFTFKGGEPHIKIDSHTVWYSRFPSQMGDEITITQRIESFNDFGILLVATDALKRLIPNVKLHLFLPYFPGARQDRVMVVGEPLTVKIYSDLINNIGFDSVTILDPHSDVTPALLNNVKVIENHKFVLNVLKDLYPQTNAKMPILISPDAGANKKVLNLAKYLSILNTLDIVKCDKTRNVKTGEITNFEVYASDLKNRDCIIVDDICDGGGTFLGLIDELKNFHGAGNVYLVVSHGIFSRGLDELTSKFSGIYTTDSVDVFKYHNGIVPSNFKVIKLNNCI